jgi:hypothetical protein
LIIHAAQFHGSVELARRPHMPIEHGAITRATAGANVTS